MNFGERLLLAFKEAHGTEDKKIIAKELGFETDKAIYKVIKGERELSFDALRRFQKSTSRSVDWLLTGIDSSETEKKTEKEDEISFDKMLDSKIRQIVKEELNKRTGAPSFSIGEQSGDKKKVA